MPLVKRQSSLSRVRGIASSTGLVSTSSQPDPESPHHDKDRNLQNNVLVTLDRKAQQLCDETRAQYELLLQQQEARYERRIQATQHQLQNVLSTYISLQEHKQIVSFQAASFVKDLKFQRKQFQEELASLEKRWTEECRRNQQELDKRVEEEKYFLALDRIAQLQLENDEACRVIKEQEMAILSERKQREEATCAQTLAETRVREACQHIVSLKTQLQKLERRVESEVNIERAEKKALNIKYQETTMTMAKMKGQFDKKVAMLESELVHTCSNLHAASELNAKHEIESSELSGRMSELTNVVTELTTREKLQSQFHEREQLQHQQHVNKLQTDVAVEQRQLSEAKRRIAELENDANSAVIQKETLKAELALLKQSNEAATATWRREKRKLTQQVVKLKQIAQQLAIERDEQQQEKHIAKLLFPNGSPMFHEKG